MTKDKIWKSKTELIEMSIEYIIYILYSKVYVGHLKCSTYSFIFLFMVITFLF